MYGGGCVDDRRARKWRPWAQLAVVALMAILATTLLTRGALDMILAGWITVVAVVLALPFLVLGAMLRSRRRTPAAGLFPLPVLFTIVGLLAALDVGLASMHPVIWPWHAGVQNLSADLCETADIENLLWTDPETAVGHNIRNPDINGETVTCEWDVTLDGERSRLATVTMDRAHFWFVVHPATSASYRLDSRRERSENVRTLPGVGEDAFIGEHGTTTVAAAWLGDVVVAVEMRFPVMDVRTVAERVLRRIVAQFRLS
jgi:hypothetical protein